MPCRHPPEFRRRAVELTLLGGKPKSQIAAELGISDSCACATGCARPTSMTATAVG